MSSFRTEFITTRPRKDTWKLCCLVFCKAHNPLPITPLGQDKMQDEMQDDRMTSDEQPATLACYFNIVWADSFTLIINQTPDVDVRSSLCCWCFCNCYCCNCCWAIYGGVPLWIQTARGIGSCKGPATTLCSWPSAQDNRRLHWSLRKTFWEPSFPAPSLLVNWWSWTFKSSIIYSFWH